MVLERGLRGRAGTGGPMGTRLWGWFMVGCLTSAAAPDRVTHAAQNGAVLSADAREEPAEPATAPASQRLRLGIRNHASLDARTLRGIASETEAVWLRYGVGIGWDSAEASEWGRPLGFDRIEVEIGVETRAGAVRAAWVPDESSGSAALGWIEFRRPCRPEPRIRLSVPGAMRIMSATRSPGPPMIRRLSYGQRQLLSRILGRALAHEVGHYLLRSAAHAPSGLMRASYPTYDLIGGSTDPFRLDDDQVAIVRGVRIPMCP